MMLFPGGGYVGEYFPLIPSQPSVLDLIAMTSGNVDLVAMSTDDPLDLVAMSSDPEIDLIGSSS